MHTWKCPVYTYSMATKDFSNNKIGNVEWNFAWFIKCWLPLRLCSTGSWPPLLRQILPHFISLYKNFLTETTTCVVAKPLVTINFKLRYKECKESSRELGCHLVCLCCLFIWSLTPPRRLTQWAKISYLGANSFRLENIRVRPTVCRKYGNK